MGDIFRVLRKVGFEEAENVEVERVRLEEVCCENAEFYISFHLDP